MTVVSLLRDYFRIFRACQIINVEIEVQKSIQVESITCSSDDKLSFHITPPSFLSLFQPGRDCESFLNSRGYESIYCAASNQNQSTYCSTSLPQGSAPFLSPEQNFNHNHNHYSSNNNTNTNNTVSKIITSS